MPRPSFAPQTQSSHSNVDSSTGNNMSITVPNWLRAYERWSQGRPWGFVGLRTCYYDDDEKWEQFRRKIDQSARLPFEADENVPAVSEASKHFSVRWIEDLKLANASIETLQEAFAALVPSLSIGQSQKILLTATPSTIDYFFSVETPTADSLRWRPGAPYVLAVSASSDPGLEEGHEERDWFREVFKVAAEALVDEFWFALEGMEWPVRKVTGGIKGVRLEDGEVRGEVGEGDDVWWSTTPSPARTMKRRRFG